MFSVRANLSLLQILIRAAILAFDGRKACHVGYWLFLSDQDFFKDTQYLLTVTVFLSINNVIRQAERKKNNSKCELFPKVNLRP